MIKINNKENDANETIIENPETSDYASSYADANVGRIIKAFEILSVNERRQEDRHAFYNCRCIYCGYESVMTIKRIREIGNKCVHYKQVGKIKVPYPKYFTPWTVKSLRIIFDLMVERCYNPEHKDYRYYGAKGVTICDDWLKAPWEFEKWALKHGWKKGLTIDRIDTKGEYSPLNCQWVERSYNGRFKRTTVPLTATVTLSTQQWSKLCGKNEGYIDTLKKRKGTKYATEFIEETLLDKKVMVKRQNEIKKKVMKKLEKEELERERKRLEMKALEDELNGKTKKKPDK